MDMSDYFKLLVALVAIIDIPGNVPIFLTQTARFTQRDRVITAVTAALATCAILLLFAMVGETVLASFGITLAAFKVLGGLVVLLIALDMLGLLREEDSLGQAKASDQGPVAIGIFPMAVPLFAGPGAITAVMVYGHAAPGHGAEHAMTVAAVIVTASVLLAVGLTLAALMARLIGPVAQVVLNRLLGMIVGALGVEFILEGLAEFFPVLGGL